MKGYLFESAKCMALTLQLMQGSPATESADADMNHSTLVSEYRMEAKHEREDDGQEQDSLHMNGDDHEVNRASLIDFYEQLKRLQSDSVINDLLSHGRFQLTTPEHPNVFAFERSIGGRCLLIVSNWGKESIDFALDRDFAEGELKVSVYPQLTLSEQMKLRPYEAFAVLI